MRTFSVLSQFEAAGSEILEFSGLVPDIVHGTEFELLPGAVDAALQSIANVSVSSELQDTLLRAGVLWYVNYFFFFGDKMLGISLSTIGMQEDVPCEFRA
ncbi:hypothetical protein HN51_063991 [Arachis hypogaea]